MKKPNYKQLILSAAMLTLPLANAQSANTLSDPDGKPADMSKPVQVFIIMGQSNTLEMGKVGPSAKPWARRWSNCWTRIENR